jgi:hypothetical protein
MSLQFVKSCAFLGSVILFFGVCAAQAQNTETGLAAADQRQIIAGLLADKFKGSTEKTIYISTANLPDEIQKNFPPIKNKQVRLVSKKEANDSEICAYQFGEFEFIDKFVSVTFGNCREGLAYDFIKESGEWKNVSSVIIREIFY